MSEAFNSAGSAFSPGVGITVDNPPSTSIGLPSAGATLSGSTALDASGSNATSVEFLLFGGTYGFAAPVICTATAPTIVGWLCAWNTTTVPNGSYSSCQRPLIRQGAPTVPASRSRSTTDRLVVPDPG